MTEQQSGAVEKKSFWERLTPGITPALLRIGVSSAVMLVLYRFFCGTRFFKRVLRPTFEIGRDAFFGMAKHAWKDLSTFVLFFIIALLVARLVDKNKPSEVGMSLGDWRKGLKWTGLFFAGMLPIVIAASFFPTFQQQYPLSDAAGESVGAFLIYQLLMLAYFLGWEFFFRGYMLFSLHKHIGNAAILVQMIPFALLHGSKPLPEALGAVFVGILLGYFALYTRTFLYCALVHFLVALSMDVAAVLQKSFGG